MVLHTTSMLNMARIMIRVFNYWKYNLSEILYNILRTQKTITNVLSRNNKNPNETPGYI